MKKRNRAGAALLALLLCASLVAPVFAADSSAPKITWLSTEVQPGFYNEELGWLTLYDVLMYRYDGVIDLKTGTRVEYDEVYAFSDGLAMVVKHVANSPDSWKYGFVDQTGALVVPLEYDRGTHSFSDGLAAVTKEDKYGFIDTTGKLVVPLEYDFAYSFSGGMAMVEKDGKCGFIDTTGKLVVPLEYDDAEDFSNGLASVAKRDADGNRKWGYIDKTGAVVVPLEYDSYTSTRTNSIYCTNFSDGLVRVGKKDADGNFKYGFVDKTGALAVPLEYDFAGDFSEGLAFVVEAANGNRKYGYVDKTGAVAVPLEYDDYSFFYGNNPMIYPRFSDGLAPAAKIDADGSFKYGFVDRTGSVVVPLEYDRAYNFSEGLAAVGKGGADGLKFGYIDTTGAVVVPLEYENVLSGWYNGGGPGFFEGLAAVGKMDAGGGWKYGYIDTTGAVVIPVEYDGVGMIYDRCDDEGYYYWEDYQPSRYRWMKKGASYGVFENPYYEASKSSSEGGGFPVVPVVIAVVVVAVVAVAAVLALAMKKKKEQAQGRPPIDAGPMPISERTSIFCPNCGAKVPMDADFCPKCGWKLKSTGD